MGPSAFALLDLVIIKALFSKLAWPVVFQIVALTLSPTPVFLLLATAIIYPLPPLNNVFRIRFLGAASVNLWNPHRCTELAHAIFQRFTNDANHRAKKAE